MVRFLKTPAWLRRLQVSRVFAHEVSPVMHRKTNVLQKLCAGICRTFNAVLLVQMLGPFHEHPLPEGPAKVSDRPILKL